VSAVALAAVSTTKPAGHVDVALHGNVPVEENEPVGHGTPVMSMVTSTVVTTVPAALAVMRRLKVGWVSKSTGPVRVTAPVTGSIANGKFACRRRRRVTAAIEYVNCRSWVWFVDGTAAAVRTRYLPTRGRVESHTVRKPTGDEKQYRLDTATKTRNAGCVSRSRDE
jgi:hypothetical protein